LVEFDARIHFLWFQMLVQCEHHGVEIYLEVVPLTHSLVVYGIIIPSRVVASILAFVLIPPLLIFILVTIIPIILAST
jgi:hypothetical protein